jgi:hypothetical protein
MAPGCLSRIRIRELLHPGSEIQKRGVPGITSPTIFLLLTAFRSRGDNFSPRMLCQWYVRGGGEGKQRILIGQSAPPAPLGMAFGRLKLSPQVIITKEIFRVQRISVPQILLFRYSLMMRNRG